MIQGAGDLFPDKPMYIVTISNAWASVGVGDPLMLMLGDVNQDLAIDILDIVLVVNFILGQQEPDNSQFFASDLNSDDIIEFIHKWIQENVS